MRDYLIDVSDLSPAISCHLNSSHDLYDALIITIVLALSIYLDQIKDIDDNLEEFVHLSDFDIVKKIVKSI